MKKICPVICSGLFFGFFGGFLYIYARIKDSLNFVNENNFLEYRMLNLIALRFQDSLLLWIKIMLSAAFSFLLVYLIWKLSIPRKIKFKAIAKLFPIKRIKFFKIARLGTRLSFFLFIFLLAVYAGSTRVFQWKSSGTNVILIVVDTLRADHLGCYGYNRNTSPNIDQLSQNSIFFTDAISQAPWTTPSIASLFTSKYPSELGIENQPVVLDDSFLTLSELFKENKYKTKGIISHFFISKKLGFNQGFDDYDEENAQGYNCISSPSLVRKAISFLEKNKNVKFFLFLHFFDPHNDYYLPPEFNYYPDYQGTLCSGQSIIELRKKASSMSEEDKEYIKALYDSEIRFTDKYIGKLLDKIKELDLFDKTMIIFTADHGEEFMERKGNWIGHTKKLYQEYIHVPLIIKLPGENHRKTVKEYTGLIDLMPTIADCLNLKIPEKYKYRGNVIDLEKRDSSEEMVFSETKRQAFLRSLIWKRWKIIYDFETQSQKLFNLKKDPLELENVIKENPQMGKKLEDIIQKWKSYKHILTKEPEFTKEQKKRIKSLGYIK